jgi:recombinational DNA repair ATPase RecF
MAELASLKISRFRSVEEAEIEFSPGMPVVLFGQNNAGKSNIIRALEIVMGEQYPKSVTLEDSDYFLRDPSNMVCIVAEFKNRLPASIRHFNGRISGIESQTQRSL